MSQLNSKLYAVLSNPKASRLLLVGLTLLGLVVSLAAPESAAACIPLGDGGIGGC